MEVEELLNLFDSYWFQSHPFFTSTPQITKIVEKEELVSCTIKAPAMHEVREKIEPQGPEQNLEMSSKLSRTQTFMVRCQSDQCLSSKDCTFNSDKSQSPKSVLLVEPKLEPILSGKECKEFKLSLEGGGGVKYRRRKKQSSSKSLSELEFEELKGFMDLGFEFSDKDKDSNLVTIIPGLRRLGREKDDEEMDESGVSRPHLSEAWGVLDEKMKMEGKKMNTLKSWRINTDHFGNNQMEIKHQLKLWAHTVASTVR